jgi:hypothetical protein
MEIKYYKILDLERKKKSENEDFFKNKTSDIEKNTN